MRVLQLIDSLNAGGAERVAVNYTNALEPFLEGSYICATRAEGLLKDQIHPNVNYLFLNKKFTLDLGAIKRLHSFIKKHKITIIHAHSSSYFLAVICMFVNNEIKVVWHDHYGNSEFLSQRKDIVLTLASKYFSHIISVNNNLKKWAEQHLKCNNVTYLPNFASFDNVSSELTQLKGVKGKRIVCLANLRPQKDHLTLIKAFEIVHKIHPDWSLHLVGKDFNDSYSKLIKQTVINTMLDDHVSFYGSKPDIFNILKQCTIGVLSSKSEGLPVALLEYGLAELAVVSTDVGEIKNVISAHENGFLVEALNENELAQAILDYIANEKIRHILAKNFNNTIKNEFSSESIMQALINIYKKLN